MIDKTERYNMLQDHASECHSADRHHGPTKADGNVGPHGGDHVNSLPDDAISCCDRRSTMTKLCCQQVYKQEPLAAPAPSLHDDCHRFL